MKNAFSPAGIRRKFSQITHLLWLAVLTTALYILAFVGFGLVCPGAFVAQGMSLSSVYRMVEHLLVSAFLLTSLSLAEELVYRK